MFQACVSISVCIFYVFMNIPYVPKKITIGLSA